MDKKLIPTDSFFKTALEHLHSVLQRLRGGEQYISELHNTNTLYYQKATLSNNQNLKIINSLFTHNTYESFCDYGTPFAPKLPLYEIESKVWSILEENVDTIKTTSFPVALITLRISDIEYRTFILPYNGDSANPDLLAFNTITHEQPLSEEDLRTFGLLHALDAYRVLPVTKKEDKKEHPIDKRVKGYTVLTGEFVLQDLDGYYTDIVNLTYRMSNGFKAFGIMNQLDSIKVRKILEQAFNNKFSSKRSSSPVEELERTFAESGEAVQFIIAPVLTKENQTGYYVLASSTYIEETLVSTCIYESDLK